MQPLYSVEHESRHSANRTEDENVPSSSESTPLLQRFPHAASERNPLTTIIVSLLLIILLAGVFIGVYLLIIQDESENILPPVELPLKLVRRAQWDRGNLSHSTLEPLPNKLKQVLVLQTGTSQCSSTESCTDLLQQMQKNATAANSTIPYNFLISSNGQTYECLGWLLSSPLSEAYTHPALILGVIGNFTNAQPTRSQLAEARNFFAESVSRQILHPSYIIVANSTSSPNNYLNQRLQELPQWDRELRL